VSYISPCISLFKRLEKNQSEKRGEFNLSTLIVIRVASLHATCIYIYTGYKIVRHFWSTVKRSVMLTKKHATIKVDIHAHWNRNQNCYGLIQIIVSVLIDVKF